MVYFENFSCLSFISSLYKLTKSKKRRVIYFIDISLFAKKFIVPFLRFFGIKIQQLDFKMIEVTDENGDLIRSRIHNVDLFNFKLKILKSKAYKYLYHESWNKSNIIDYIDKGLIDGAIDDINSVSRMLYIINVIDWHSKKLGKNKSTLFINNRPWLNSYEEFADQYNIKVIKTIDLFFSRFDIKKTIREYPFLYKFIRNIKYKNIVNHNLISSNNKLYLDGRGDINLSNNGMHSDFFWQQNSSFLLKNILFKHVSNEERDYFFNNGLISINEGVYSSLNYSRNYIKPVLNYSNEFKKEHKAIKTLLSSYDLDRFYWASLFRQFDVKVFLSWDKYSNKHITLSHAIRDNGGISVNWQMAFDGFLNTECLLNSDIVFSYSSFSDEIEKKLKSKIKYNVIIGYPKDYAPALLKDEANLIRSKLKSNGAKKIVFVIDENSVEDPRWHTGHDLQRENYSYILEKVLETPWLGVIFKPKQTKNLRLRLGPVEKLLDKAISTGRCYIFDESGRHTTSAPPVLAGLASDVCIHGHLSAGTAALECALEGIPTLLIDREGAKNSKLYELPKGKVIFQDWPSAIDALMEYFNSPDESSNFGDWSSIIDELDPFRDGMAANRMGTYLKWLIDGYDNNLEREVIMINAANKYKKIWGDDKVILG